MQHMTTDDLPSQATLIIFTKPPTQGLVKTRLFGRYGRQRATYLYRKMLYAMTALGSQASCRLELCYTHHYSHPFFRRLQRDFLVSMRQQSTGDLGKKMYSAFSQNFRNDPNTPVIIVGGDCLGIKQGDLITAVETLNKGQAVFIPSTDGGYVAIGMPNSEMLNHSKSIFQDMPWGTPKVWPTTQARLKILQIPYQQQVPRWDIDLPNDIKIAQKQGVWDSILRGR